MSEFYRGSGFNIIIYESLAGSTRNNLDARFALQKWAHIYSDVTHRAVHTKVRFNQFLSASLAC